MKSNNFKVYISTNLQYLRKLNGKTQKDIGILCNKKDTAISNWEKGIREPDAIDLGIIANYFNVTIDDIIFKDLRLENVESLSENEALFNNNKKHLTESDWNIINTIAKQRKEEKEKTD